MNFNNNEYEALSEFSDPNSMDQIELQAKQLYVSFLSVTIPIYGIKYEIQLVGLYDKPLNLDGANQISVLI